MKVYIVVGGLWHAKELECALLELGHDVILLSPYNSKFTILRLMRLPLKISGRFPVLRIVTHPIYSFLASKLIRKPDLILCWSSFGFALKKFKYSCPIVLIRGNNHIVRQHEILGNSDLGALVDIHLEERDYALADVISVPTVEIQQDEYWNNKNVLVAPYGFPKIDTRNILLSKDTLSEISVVFSGEFCFRKGSDRYKNIFREPIDGVRFSLVGKAQNKDYPLPKWWINYGQVSLSESRRIISEADILILLSREEGMARVGLESISFGKPILITPETGLSVWAKLGCGIVVSSEPTKEDICYSIKTIAANYTSYSSKCLEIRDMWTWKHHVQLILDQIACFGDRQLRSKEED